MTDTIVGPAHWHNYLVMGDASDLEPGEAAIADAWLAREGVRVIRAVPYADAWFSYQVATFAPELDCLGCAMLDYVCEPVTRPNLKTKFRNYIELIKYCNSIGARVSRSKVESETFTANVVNNLYDVELVLNNS